MFLEGDILGWIRRHWFWYTHHNLYIEPTPEQKARLLLQRKYSRRQFAMVMAVAMALNEQVEKR